MYFEGISIEILRIRGRGLLQNSPHSHLSLHQSPDLPSQAPLRPLGSCNPQSPLSPCTLLLTPSPPQWIGGGGGGMRKTGVDSCYWCRNWLVHIGGDFRSFWNDWWYSDKTQFPSIFDSIHQWMEISDCERKLILVSPHWIVLQCLLLEHFSKIVGFSPDSSSICF